MVTVTLDEITLNAVKAALDERIEALTTAVKRWEAMNNHLPTEDTQRALVWTTDAWLQAKRAREIVGDAEVVDHSENATWATA